ncbi:hypothetical protein A4X13_0g1275 [Tilletia indica]|uniref:Carboxylic ester hydrolase n=1 Tax=Tilletia indica TaxID=43049 RepID=A0A8T8TER8_9BASI|nr:hypothetical protein A4X13_0g1275 [Tilletia indica]
MLSRLRSARAMLLSSSPFSFFICATILATTVTASLTAPTVPPHQRGTANDPLLVVNTTSGQVRGQNLGLLYAYKGIPYGSPTGGTNRFRAPSMAPWSNDIIDGTDFGPSCPQFVNNVSTLVSAFTASPTPPVEEQSEDCLSVNVFVQGGNRAKAPFLNNGQGGAAVMIWIFGGSFLYGTSSSMLYNPQNFVESNNDIIVVSFNYRTNIFGFPQSPQIRKMDAAIGFNRGLEDRDLVIQWVHNNIARFGGDPNRITLFGESAGGVSVDTWAFANANNPKPLVKGLIVQSGAVSGLDLSLGDPNTNWSRPLSPWNQVANHPSVDCGRTSDDAQLQCMQQVDFPVLLRAIDETNVNFGPSVDNKLYFDDWVGRSALGQFAKVPMMMGTNADEGTVLSGLLFTDIAGMVTQSSLITPLIFTCPARQEVSDRIANGVPAWRYVYHGNWDNMNSGITALGAYHFSEVPIVFRTFPAAYLSNLSHPVEIPPQQEVVSSWMQGAWAAFARNPQRGLTNYGWPKYSPLSRTLAHIARNNSAAADFSTPDPVDLGCNLGVPIEAALYTLIRKLGSAL